MPRPRQHRTGARAVALVLLGLLLAAPACGGDEPPRLLSRVQLEIASPADRAVVEDGDVTLRGRVTPRSAAVEVRGRAVTVRGGSWRADVELDPGPNVIDVSASAPDRRPAVGAVRVVRQLPVEVPDVEGDDPQEAVQRLEAVGLQAEVRRGGGLLDDLLPASIGVCASDPEPGTEVRVGTTVRLEVARVC
jgi:hypothetical protein